MWAAASAAYSTAQAVSTAGNAVNQAGVLAAASITTFVSYFGIEAYRGLYSSVRHGLNRSSGAADGKSSAAHVPVVGGQHAQVFLAGFAAIVFEWIQFQGARKMKDYTMRGDSGMPFYGAYAKHPYYRGEQSYSDIKGDWSGMIVRRIVNMMVGVSVQMEQIFFQTGNFDHLTMVSNLFQTIGFYEILVYALRMHGWSPIQTALTTILRGSNRIKAAGSKR